MDQTLLNYLIQANKDSRFYYLNGLDIELPKYASNSIKARYNKVSRIREHFIYMICRRKYIYFLTFTFNDNYINKCDRTKKDLIKSCLNDIEDSLYILNIDYGSKTERQHYHCLLATDYPFADDIYFKLTYPCFSYLEKVVFNNKSIDKVCKYINKLSNHACKDSTQYSRIYYNFKGYNKILDKGYRNTIKLCDKTRVYK